jgi:hypothetical protein
MPAQGLLRRSAHEEEIPSKRVEAHSSLQMVVFIGGLRRPRKVTEWDNVQWPSVPPKIMT